MALKGDTMITICDSLLDLGEGPCVLYLDCESCSVCTDPHGDQCVAIACPPRAVPESLQDALRSERGQRYLEAVVMAVADHYNPLAYETAVRTVEIYLDQSTARICPAIDFLHLAWAAAAARDIRTMLAHGETLQGIAGDMVEEAIEGPVGVVVDFEDMLNTLEALLEQHQEDTL